MGVFHDRPRHGKDRVALGLKKQDLGLLLLRVAVGVPMILLHGVKKLPPSEGFVTGLGNLGLPLPWAMGWAAALAETVGALLLVVGLGTRWAAGVLAIAMGVAVFLWHANDPLMKKEAAMFYLAACMAMVLQGGGNWALERLIQIKRR
jgi:putative oxidoreductase